MPIVSAVVAGALKIVGIRIARAKAEMRHGGKYHSAIELTAMVRCKILPHYQLACTHVCTHSLDRSNLFYSTRGLKKNQKFRKKPYLM